ncbi:coiled-coil domain-containing protein 63 [Clonorchis sinensis]|uniref:Coiled-coil domain-containing protein 63 n=1 Tax=Clonorchis sinensis TaxID=79923 RepID=G7YT41_CLOSI|nr:coiled-coil domain-containing protein 63 [Clonorchis sinensis]
MPILDRKQDTDAEGAAEREVEYHQLKVALHVAQVDRSRYVEEMNTAMTKMKQTIECLEQEGEELLEKLRAIDSKPNQIRDQRMCEDLLNLAENKDWLQEQIEAEKAKHMDLDAKIRSMEKKVSEMKIKLGGTMGSDDSLRRVRTKLTTLENRLVHVLKSYNEEVGKNMQLRSEIDTLRMQRAKFDQLYRKLEQTLSKQRAAIGQLIEATSQAYEQREDAAQRIQQLTEKAEKDTQQHNNEMKELVRLIDHDRKLKHFMKIKATERQEDPQLTAWKAKRIQEADERRAEVDRLIDNYEQAFDRMLEVMEEANPENLVQGFLEKEDRNFALFNYVNETNAEIERLNEDNENMAAEIDNYEEKMTKVVDVQKDALSEWQLLNEAAREQQENTEARLSAANETIKTVCDIVSDIIQKLQCDTTMLTRRLASSEGITQSNLLDYLTLVEQRVNQLLLIRQFIAVNDPDAPFVAKSILIGNNLNSPPTDSIPSIHPPSLQDDFDEASEISVLKPYSREELHRRVVTTVRRKENGSRANLSMSVSLPKGSKI